MLRFRSRVLRFRVLGASFSRFRVLRFRSRVLRFRDLGASCFGLRFRVLRFRNYPFVPPNPIHVLFLAPALTQIVHYKASCNDINISVSPSI